MVRSVYRQMPVQELKLDYGDGSALNVRFRGFEDTVIWNPTESIGKDIADMEDGGWASQGSLCVRWDG
jgi:D-hexose-6-phosphate mutarotase